MPEYVLIESGDANEAENVDAMFGHPALVDYVHPDEQFTITLTDFQNGTITVSSGKAYIGVEQLLVSTGEQRNQAMVAIERNEQTVNLQTTNGINHLFLDANIGTKDSPLWKVFTTDDPPSPESIKVATIEADSTDSSISVELHNQGPDIVSELLDVQTVELDSPLVPSNYVTSEFNLTYDSTVPEVSITKGTAIFRQLFPVTIGPVTRSLTDNAVNHIFAASNLDKDVEPEIVVNTTGSVPSNSVKIAEIDTSSDTVLEGWNVATSSGVLEFPTKSVTSSQLSSRSELIIARNRENDETVFDGSVSTDVLNSANLANANSGNLIQVGDSPPQLEVAQTRIPDIDAIIVDTVEDLPERPDSGPATAFVNEINSYVQLYKS